MVLHYRYTCLRCVSSPRWVILGGRRGFISLKSPKLFGRYIPALSTRDIAPVLKKKSHAVAESDQRVRLDLVDLLIPGKVQTRDRFLVPGMQMGEWRAEAV